MTDKFRSEPPREDIGESMANLVRIWQEAAIVAADIAHSKRAIFQAYVAEGFSEAQALELIKSL